MATDFRTIATSTDTVKKGLKAPQTDGPILDEEGNIVPYPGYTGKKEPFCPPSPIARLAVAGSLDKPIPTAGNYGIERSKEPDLHIPPECYLYDEDRPWVLGKLNKEALDLPEPAEPIVLPKHVLDYLDALETAANTITAAHMRMSDEERAARGDEYDTAKDYEKAKAAALAALKAKTTPESDPAAANVKKSVKPKSRNASASPASHGRRSSTSRATAPATSSAPRVLVPDSTSRTAGQQVKAKTPSKSPGRGDAPPGKLPSSARSNTTAPKKVANAK